MPEVAAPGRYLIVGTVEYVDRRQPSQVGRLFLTSHVQVVATRAGQARVFPSWQLADSQDRAAVWRCQGGECAAGVGVWKMIAPLLPAGEEQFEDSDVAVGQTYYYKVQAYDALGNEGGFGEAVNVTVDYQRAALSVGG